MPARYNAREPMTAKRLKLGMLLLLVLLLLAALPGRAAAQAISSLNSEFLDTSAEWAGVADRFAGKIAAFTGETSISITIQNLSSITPREAQEVKRLVEGRLGLAGARVTSATGAAYSVNVTIAENARGFVLTATTPQPNAENVLAMVAVPRAHQSEPAPALLRKELLLRLDRPMLDAQLSSDGRLVVLEPDRLTIYGKTGGEWQSQSSAQITASRPFPRDLRGKLMVNLPDLVAYLPGTVCTATAVAPVALTCRESDDPWPVAGQPAFFNSARNYFTRTNGPFAEYVTRFYSAVFFSASRVEERAVFTDERGVWRDGENGPLPVSTPGWGSDAVLVEQNDPAQSHILAAREGDYQQADSIRAYQVVEQNAVAASDPLEFAGPVLALWPTSDPNAATAITHNLQTGSYEAYRITASTPQ